jgi:hypothetical protein
MRFETLGGWRGATLLAVILGSSAVLLAACGGSESGAKEPSGTYTLEVVKASFPAKQAVARPSVLTLAVRNAGQTTAPDVAVAVRSFYYRSEYPGLANRARPIWIVDSGPGATPATAVETVPFDSPGADVTATTNIWAAGALAAGQTRTFRWQLEPVKAGEHTVAYTVGAGLNGRARASSPSGSAVAGSFSVAIAKAPPASHVDPETGVVKSGAYPVAPGP